jgi:carbon storage regulator
MLVLSRRQGEAIVIDGGIRVSVATISRRQVRLAIEAPREVQVDREELRERKLAQAVVAGPS